MEAQAEDAVCSTAAALPGDSLAEVRACEAYTQFKNMILSSISKLYGFAEIRIWS